MNILIPDDRNREASSSSAGWRVWVRNLCVTMAEARRNSILFGKLWALFFTHLTQGIHTTLPYVVGVYMVRDFLSQGGTQGPSEKEIGFLTGILGACFCAAQFFTSYPLGKLSDRIGRKPILIVGNVSCIVGALGFGAASRFWQACLSRIVMGTFNAIIGAEKAMIGEALKREEQSDAMKHFSLVWGLGTLAGPVMGGMLASPCDADNIIRGPTAGLGLCRENGDGIFDKKPFLLPCIAAACTSVIALIGTLFFMSESLPRLAGNNGSTEYKQVGSIDEDAMYKKNSDLQMYVNDDIELSTTIKAVAQGNFFSDQEKDEEPVSIAHDVESSKEIVTIMPWYKQMNVLLALGGYASIAFCFIMLDELIPIFASAPKEEGGLDFSPSELSGPLAFGGLVLVLWILFGYKWMNERFGIINTCKHGLYQTLPMTLMFPLCSIKLVPAMPMMWIAITMKYIAATNAFTSCLVLVNLVAPKDSLGEVNGLGQTLASGVRSLGPALAGIIWAGSIQLFHALGQLWGHQFLPFCIVSFVAFLTLFIYRRMSVPSEEL